MGMIGKGGQKKNIIVVYPQHWLLSIVKLSNFEELIVCRLVYKKQHFCYTLGNHDYFLRITSLNRKNIVAIFSVWSRGDFQHKMYKNMKNPRKNWF